MQRGTAQHGWIRGVLWPAVSGLADRNGIEIAGYMAFTAMLALFPFLIFLVAISGFLGETSAGQDFIATLSLFAPPDVVKTLQPAIEEVTAHRSGGLLTIGLLLALYSAGSGVSAMRLALNLSYGLDETRSFWLRKAQDFLIVIGGSVILIVASLAIILGPLIWHIVQWNAAVDTKDETLYHLARYGFSLVLIVTGIVALHRLLPDTSLTFRSILPGALATTVLWVLAASGLTVYFGQVGNYSATYGSLGGAVVTLMFFYISAIILIFGGELNAALMAYRKTRARPAKGIRPSAVSSASSPQ